MPKVAGLIITFTLIIGLFFPTTNVQAESCQITASPAEIKKDTTNLTINVKSTSLPSNKKYILHVDYFAPGESIIRGIANKYIDEKGSLNIGSSGIDIAFTKNAVFSSGWSPGTYKFDFYDTTSGFLGIWSGNLGNLQCSKQIKFEEAPNSSCKIEVTNSDKLNPDTPIEVQISGLGSGSYDVNLIGGGATKSESYTIKAQLTSSKKFNFGQVNPANYQVEVRSSCGKTGIVTNCVSFLQCTPVNFTVKDRQGNSPSGAPIGGNGKVCKSGDPECSSSAGMFCDPTKNGVKGPGNGILTAIGCVPTEPKVFVEALFKVGTGVGGGIAFLMMVSGVIQMMTAGSSANAEQFKSGKDRLTGAIIGLLFIIFSVLLLRIIGFDILGINSWLNQ